MSRYALGQRVFLSPLLILGEGEGEVTRYGLRHRFRPRPPTLREKTAQNYSRFEASTMRFNHLFISSSISSTVARTNAPHGSAINRSKVRFSSADFDGNRFLRRPTRTGESSHGSISICPMPPVVMAMEHAQASACSKDWQGAESQGKSRRINRNSRFDSPISTRLLVINPVEPVKAKMQVKARRTTTLRRTAYTGLLPPPPFEAGG